MAILHTGSDQPPRFGLVTTKRLGSAVVRNRIRRQCREIIRKHLSNITPGIWMVIIARQQAAKTPQQRLEADWLRLARRSAVLNSAASQPTQ